MSDQPSESTDFAQDIYAATYRGAVQTYWKTVQETKDNTPLTILLCDRMMGFLNSDNPHDHVLCIRLTPPDILKQAYTNAMGAIGQRPNPEQLEAYDVEIARVNKLINLH